MATITTVLLWFCLPAIVLLTVLAWISESQTQRIRRLRRAGMTQAAIAKTVGCTPYRVRKALQLRPV